MNGRPQSKKRLSTTSLMCGLLVGPQFIPFGTLIWPQSIKNVKIRSKLHEKMTSFLFSGHEWHVMGPKEVFYLYLVPEMIW